MDGMRDGDLTADGSPADAGGADAGADAADAAELISRLRVIESQPLPDRAAAYAAVRDELAGALDAGPATSA